MVNNALGHLFGMFKQVNRPKEDGGLLEKHHQTIILQSYYNQSEDVVYLALIPLVISEGGNVVQEKPLKMVKAEQLQEIMQYITDNTTTPTA